MPPLVEHLVVVEGGDGAGEFLAQPRAFEQAFEIVFLPESCVGGLGEQLLQLAILGLGRIFARKEFLPGSGIGVPQFQGFLEYGTYHGAFACGLTEFGPAAWRYVLLDWFDWVLVCLARGRQMGIG